MCMNTVYPPISTNSFVMAANILQDLQSKESVSKIAVWGFPPFPPYPAFFPDWEEK